MPAESREILFGDDWESDPLSYSLYADIVAGRLEAGVLEPVLRGIGVDARLIDEVHRRAAAVARADVVARIFINLERRTPPAMFRSFGARLVPTFNYFQTAVCLFEMGQLTLPAVTEVATSLADEAGYTPQRLAVSLADIVRRGHLRPAAAAAVRVGLQPEGLLPRHQRARRRTLWEQLTSWLFPQRLAEQIDVVPPSTAIDYEELVAHWRAGRKERRA